MIHPDKISQSGGQNVPNLHFSKVFLWPLITPPGPGALKGKVLVARIVSADFSRKRTWDGALGRIVLHIFTNFWTSNSVAIAKTHQKWTPWPVASFSTVGRWKQSSDVKDMSDFWGGPGGEPPWPTCSPPGGIPLKSESSALESEVFIVSKKNRQDLITNFSSNGSKTTRIRSE